MSHPITTPLIIRAETLHNRIQEFIDYEMPSVRPQGQEEFYRYVADFASYCQDRGRSLTRETVMDYCSLIIKKHDGASPGYRRLKCVKRFLTWLFRMNYTTTRWYEYFPRMRTSPPGDVKIIGYGEYLRIRKACFNKNQEWIVVLGYSTGMRLGDCCTLRWSQVNQENQTIKKPINKNRHNTGRYTFIPYESGSDLHKFIIDLWDSRDYHVIDEDNPVNPEIYLSYMAGNQSLCHRFKNIFERAGVAGKSFKHFRSTFDSLMANSGMNMVLATKITGRTDVKTLLRYVQPDLDVAREGVARALELHTTVKGFA